MGVLLVLAQRFDSFFGFRFGLCSERHREREREGERERRKGGEWSL